MPRLLREALEPIFQGRKKAHIFDDVVLGDLARRNVTPVGVADRVSEDPLDEKAAERVVQDRTVPQIGHRDLCVVDEVVDLHVIVGDTAPTLHRSACMQKRFHPRSLKPLALSITIRPPRSVRPQGSSAASLLRERMP